MACSLPCGSALQVAAAEWQQRCQWAVQDRNHALAVAKRAEDCCCCCCLVTKERALHALHALRALHALK